MVVFLFLLSRIAASSTQLSSKYLQIIASNEYGSSQAEYEYFSDTVILVEPFKNTTLQLIGRYPSKNYDFNWIIDGFDNNLYGTSINVTFLNVGAFDVKVKVSKGEETIGTLKGVFLSK